MRLDDDKHPNTRTRGSDGALPVAVVDAFEEAWGMTKADCPPYWSGWSGHETEKPAHARL